MLAIAPIRVERWNSAALFIAAATIFKGLSNRRRVIDLRDSAATIWLAVFHRSSAVDDRAVSFSALVIRMGPIPRMDLNPDGG